MSIIKSLEWVDSEALSTMPTAIRSPCQPGEKVRR